jgi:SAM-dependent methyltransferase
MTTRARDAVAITPARVRAGYAPYTPALLRIYDRGVLGINSRFIWRCPVRHLREHFAAHVTSSHLDVGVGTGYFLAKATFPTESPRIALMDMSRSALDFAADRLRRYSPQTIEHNVLEPYAASIEPFSSVSMNYLLHCVPGNLRQKKVVFEHLVALLEPGGVLFGATILTHGVPTNFFSRAFLRYCWRIGIMNSEEDDLDDLRAVLDDVFDRSEVRVQGMVAIFTGWKAAA